MNDTSNTKTQVPAFLMTTTGTISLVIGDNHYSVSPDHQNYKAIVDALKSEHYEGLVDLVDISRNIANQIGGKAELRNGAVFVGGHEINNVVTDRILALRRDGFPVEFMIRFLENIMSNPSAFARDELYEFLENNELPITPDGHFLAYKKVRDDYRDFYSGSYDHSIGAVLEMEREAVDADRERTCSHGLHFCSYEYLPQYWGGTGRVVILKINPRDVVSIPTDYNLSKGRACRYEVVAEHGTDDQGDQFDKAAWGEDGQPIDAEEYCEYCGEMVDDCVCDDYACPDCGCEDCICDGDEERNEWCDQCGKYLEFCTCNDSPTVPDGKENILSPQSRAKSAYHNQRGPDGRFVSGNGQNKQPKPNHNVRGPDGRFVSASATHKPRTGSDILQAYHNVRDSKGRFVKSK